ncbi:MAG TPA: hypothetical protein VFL60_06275 [Gaiellaceae bacterium]|nr:hypothetical protein [Gaiellaceae bacterium]
MKHAAAFLSTAVVLWWLWQALVGTWDHYDWLFAAAGALVAGAIGELAATRTKGRAPLPLAILASAPSALGMVVVDFGLVMYALVRRRRGVVRETRFDHPDTFAFRAWATLVADWSPNAFVIDVGDGKSVTHHLVPDDRSQSPV